MERLDRTTIRIAVCTAVIVTGIAAVVTVVETGVVADEPRKAVGEAATVKRVIDGDTIVVNESRKIRLLGIDAPEKEMPCFDEARIQLQEAVANRTVRLTRDLRNRGRYDRLLRYVHRDGKNVNVELVRNGFVFARISPDVGRHREVLIDAERRARTVDHGCVWRHVPTAPTGKEVVAACNADQYKGETVTVQGDVVDTGESDGTVFLNLEKPYPDTCFTAVVFRGARHRFPVNLREKYRGETVSVAGTVRMSDDTPEIVVRAPRQITTRQP